MVEEKAKKTIRKYGWKLSMLFLLCLQILIVLYYGGRKAGFHEDEYYSYYSTNRTAGLYEPDREWVDKEIYRNEFVVTKEERFNYGMVKTVQSWDVHPPLFYYLLHTASSLMPGVFSKWLGIGINLIAYVGSFFLLAWLAFMMSEKNKKLTFLICMVHGFNGVVISGVLFIRMYEWLTFFALLCACLHVREMKEGNLRLKRFLLPVMAASYLGFLTQYYYLVFLFFIAAGFCLWMLWRDRKLINCIKYGFSLAAAILLAIISYPASLAHIFRGYRGTGAVSEFIDMGNTWDRLGFFYGLMNEYVFDGFFLPLLTVLSVTGFFLYLAGKRKQAQVKVKENNMPDRKPYFLLLFAVCGYFFTVSKTALLLYETSNRYQIPIYGILLLLVISAFYIMGRKIADMFSVSDGIRKTGLVLLVLLFMAGDIHSLASGKVLFLYEEEAASLSYAKENAYVPVVVLYNDATPYHVWWRSGELLEYEGVYFASQANKEKITDEIICSSDKLIVYAADYETKEDSLNMILESNKKLKNYKLISQKTLWSVYEFQ